MKFVGLIKHEQKYIKSSMIERWEELIESTSLLVVIKQVKQWEKEVKLQPHRKGCIHTYATHVLIKK